MKATPTKIGQARLPTFDLAARRDIAPAQPRPQSPLYVDPWRAVCERCPLPDCIRQEGEYGSLAGRNWTENAQRRLSACPVFVAQREGVTAARLLADGAVAGVRLLPVLSEVEGPAWGVG